MPKNNKNIVIVDYGVGNTGTILNMVRKIGFNCLISNDITVLMSADKIILPGVGSFDRAMENLKDLELIDALNGKAFNEKIPVLGICLGMQLLAKDSTEGVLPGLGWIDANVKKFDIDKALKVPHMGWNYTIQQKESSLFFDMYTTPRFYHVHSYYFVCNNDEDILTTTNYGGEFTSSVNKGNIYGVQFHPEKSHKFGMKLLENFAKI